MITRMTSQIMNNNAMNHIMRNQNKLFALQEQALTEKKVNRLYDDPVAVNGIMQSNKQLDEIATYLKNVGNAKDELGYTDQVLGSLTQKLQDLNALTVQASNGTNTPEALYAIKTEVDQIIETIKTIGNTNYNNKYIFAGTNTATVPFTDNPDGSIDYNGTQGTDYKREIEISEGLKITLNANGESIFGSWDETTQTGTGLFGTLKKLSADLESGDFSEIKKNIDGVQASLTRVNTYRAQLGAAAQKVEMTENSLKDTKVLITDRKSGLEDIDAAEILSALMLQQYSLEASMKVASTTMGSSLLNYL